MSGSGRSLGSRLSYTAPVNGPRSAATPTRDEGAPGHGAYYRALSARDRRFDGVFFVGVTSTGIYCRPICPARTPKPEHCRFFPSAAAAERASFRPCLRCRPELAPGNAPVDGAQRVALRLLDRIAEDDVDGTPSLTQLADELGLSTRQLRRVARRELGATPSELQRTRRLLLAKQLLTETDLPVIEIAFASGFHSLRRFNEAFRTRYGMPPTHLRKHARGAAHDPADPTALPATLTLRLAYRPPYDWDGTLAFQEARALAGVEAVTAGAYARTLRLGHRHGWLRVTHDPAAAGVLLEVSRTLTPALPAVLARVRRLFDLEARPDVIAAQLQRDATLAAAVRRHRGLRVPGAVDPFELAVRAVLGQQVSVKAATTLAGRFVRAFATPLDPGDAATDGRPTSLTHLFPTPESVAALDPASIAALGIVGARAGCIVALAKAFAAGQVTLAPGDDASEQVRALTALPGIGPWTAQYVAMRAMHLPDAFPKEDLVVRKALGGVSAAAAAARAEAWRPWRSYATLHLWRMAAERATGADGEVAAPVAGSRGPGAARAPGRAKGQPTRSTKLRSS